MKCLHDKKPAIIVGEEHQQWRKVSRKAVAMLIGVCEETEANKLLWNFLLEV